MKKLILLLLVPIFLITLEAWAGPATDQLKGTLDELIGVLNDPALKDPTKEAERTEALHNVLKSRFDEEAIAARALGKHWKGISPEEKQTFIPLFTSLLERTYFEKIDAQLEESGQFSSSDIRYLGERVKGKLALVTTAIKTGEESDDIPVIYRMKQVAGAWLIIDMKIEGVIITKNYRAQFNETLSRDSMAGLIAKLKEKQLAK